MTAMARLTKCDFLREALDQVTSALTLKCTDLTLLTNACYEAAKWRREHGMPHVEKYDAMHERLYNLGLDLDKRIDRQCEHLLEKAEKSKRDARQ